MEEEQQKPLTADDVRAIFRAEIQKALNTRTQPDRTIHEKNIQLLDGRSIQVGRTNGTTIGTASDQKLSVYGVTPVVQHNAITGPSGGGTSSTDAIDQSARASITVIIAVLKAFGITK